MGSTRKSRKKGLFSRKAQVEVITVMLILGITVAAVFVAYQFAAPQIERSKDVSRISSMQKAFLELDNKIREVRFEGEGAQRYIDINFDKGNIRVDQNDDTIWFYMSAPGIESAPQETGMETYFSDRTINIKLQYGGEIEITSKFNLLNASQYRIYIKNEGGNDILLSLSPDIPITGDTWTLQGYVYDNTEGGNNNGTGDENQPSMDNNGNNKILDADDDAPLANAEIIFFNQKLETVAIAKTNSQGRYAVKLPESVGVTDLELYIKVSVTSYVMKENDGASTVYSKTELYHKSFNKNLGTWHVNVQNGTNDFTSSTSFIDGYFNIPMYKLSKQDVFESVPIAVVMLDTPGVGLDVTQTDFDNLLFDVMDAFDSDAGSTYHCRYFVVYGSVSSPEGIGTGGGNWINYPDSAPAQNIEIYPIEWLLDPTSDKGPSDYGAYTMFNDIAAIDGNPDILNYKDFSLILVSTGATSDANLLPKLHTYKYSNDLSNFLSLDRLSFKGVDYSRGLVVFSQFSKVSNSDPDAPTQFYPSGSTDIDPPDIYNIIIVPDGQEGYDTSVVGLQPPVYINSSRGGKVVFAANVRDSNEIISVNAVVLNSTGASVLGGITLLDNGISPDRIAGDGTFAAEWAVPSTFTGTYRLRIEAIDEFGNLASKSQYVKPDNSYGNYQFLVTVDNTSPLPLAALSSSLGNLTTSPYTYLSSSIQDNNYIDRIMYENQRLYVGSNVLPSEVNNYYSFVPLSEGIYNYSVITYDRADNYALQSMIIDRDNTQPFINEYLPQGTTLIAQPWVNVSYSDIQAGIAGAKLYYDGNPVAVATSPIDSTKVVYFPPIQPDGTHSADVNISDKLGNVNWFTWQFNIGYAGPLVNVTSPANPITFVNAANINVSGTSDATGGVTVNGVAAGGPPNFTLPVPLTADSTNFIKIEADGAPGGTTNNSVITKIVVEDSTTPVITAFNSATSSSVANAGGRAYIDFNYNENYPAYYKITVKRGATILGETNTTINTPGTSFIKAGGTKRIVGAVDIYTTATTGLCDITITMVDLAGNIGSQNYANALRIDVDGPVIQVSPANNASGSSTTAIQVSLTDVNAGIFRDSLKMYILGETNSSGNSINLDVTKSVKLEKITDGYKMIYEPSWPLEDMTKVNITVESSDKAGNIQSSSTFYNIANNTLTVDNFKISSNRAAEGETVKVEFDVKQCVANPPGTNNQFDAINEVTVTVGNLGKIVYVTDGIAGASRLVRSSTLSTLSGGPADLVVTYDGTSGGVCSGATILYKYSFTGNNGITFTVPGYAGDLNNPIKITAKNHLNIRKTYSNDLYLITVKNRNTTLDKTYGKYSWLPSLDGSDLSIGRVSEEPVGTRYEIYGEVHDVNRRIPVTRTVSGISTVYNVSPIDSDRILWDRGYIVRTNAQKRFLLPDSNYVDLVNYQNNIEKVSLENTINNVLPNEFALSVHGYFDTTNTLWVNSNFILKEKSFPKIYSSTGNNIISVPFTPGGPVLLIRERRDTFNNLVSNVVVMTMDLDRYKNNRQAQGQNLHSGEPYVDLAKSLEENVIVWACGHELLIDS